MRTNIVLDDQLVEEARALSGIKTKKEVIEKALLTYIQIQRQIQIRELREPGTWEGDLDQIKTGRTYDIG